MGFLIHIQDVTEQKQAEEELERSDHQIKLILESVGEGIYGVDLKGNTTFVNQAAVDITGFTSEELIGRHQHEILQHSDFNKVFYPWQDCPIYAALEDGLDHYGSNEFFRRKNDQYFPVEYVSAPIREQGKVVGAVVVFKDITERKRAEEEREKMQAQLFQAQKLEAIGLLAGGIAHDFNNLLTVIQGFTNLAMKRTDNSEPLYSDLKRVQAASEKASNLVRQLLLFSRRQPTVIKSIDINKIINRLFKMLHRLIGENITIKIDLEKDIWPIKADEGNIEQSIMNLAINARDAMPHGGKLTILTRNMTLIDKRCECTKEIRSGRFVYLAIKDTGIGIEKDIIPHIFEPFFTTKKVGRGTGLGLSVVYGIVNQHGGCLDIESEVGKGTRFDIYLPVSNEEIEEEKKKIVNMKALQGHGEKILLVEDDSGVREYINRILQENKYNVSSAENAYQALDIFEGEKGNFDLVIIDIVLPDKNGVELTDQFRSYKPGVAVILISGYLEQKTAWPTSDHKEISFIQKPITQEILLLTLKKLLGTAQLDIFPN
ncbi:MAG: PAS domain S-box protein [bacterium]